MDLPAANGETRRPTVVGLDVLRLFAALLVVSYHFLFFSWIEPVGHEGIRDAVNADIAFPGAVGFSWWGWIGVELFFVISGYVISMSAGRKTPIGFAIDRIVRLYPALLFFSTCALVVVIGAGVSPVPIAVEHWIRAATLFPKGPWIDGVIWTLVIEAIFYFAIFTTLLCGGIARLPTLARFGLAVTTGFWAMVMLSYFIDLGDAGAVLRSLASAYASKVVLLTTGSFFLVGMFAYEIFERGVTRERVTYILLAVLGSLASIWHGAIRTEGVADFGGSPLLPMSIWLFATLLCGLAISVERRRPPGPRYRALARRLGLITYPLYLMHNITGGWMMGRLRDAGTSMVMAATLAFIVCLAGSYLFAMFIEPPMQRLVRQWLSLAPTPYARGSKEQG